MYHPITAAEVQYELEHVDDNRQQDLIDSLAAGIVLAYIAVLLRLLARRISKASLQADDYWVLFSLFLLTSQMAAGIINVQVGAGRHAILLRKPSEFAKTALTIEMLYVTTAGMIKFSILSLYDRLFGSQKRFRIIIIAIGVFVLLHTFVEVVVLLFQCRPVNGAWDVFTQSVCVNIPLAAIIMGSINVVIDFVVLLLPMPLVWSLQIQKKWKIQLVGIFLLGGFVCITSIYRTATVGGLAKVDASWAETDCAIWAFVENAIGIVSACLPVLRPIYNIVIYRHHCTVQDDCPRCQSPNNSQGPRSMLNGTWHRMIRRSQGKSHAKNITGTTDSSDNDLESGEKNEPSIEIL